MHNKSPTKKISDSGFTDWTPDQLFDLSGKTYVITGANIGLGFETAKMLGNAGGNIVIACRNLVKGRQAADELSRSALTNVDLIQLDLSNLSSVREAADEVQSRYLTIDGLINNAGIMQTPQFTTEDGYELQFATNHLGHFLWSGLLYRLVEAAGGRIVVVSSIGHKRGSINFDDLMLTQNYNRSKAYFQSKLANLLFARELDRRLKANCSSAQCIACHPGISQSNLFESGPSGMLRGMYKIATKLLTQPTRNGAIPSVLAAAGSEARAGAYYGPQAMGETRGRVSDALVALPALDEDTATRLWAESEKMVGFEWEFNSSVQGH